MRLSKYRMSKCIAFAKERAATSKGVYASRGESSENKMYEDALIGAMGEWAVYEFFKESGHKVSKPDMKLYKSNLKNYSHDLFTEKYNIHVKAQGYTSFLRYGHSWLLQRRDPLVLSPTEKDYLVCCHVNLEDGEVTVTGIIKVLNIAKNNLWGECRVPAYAKTKVALYMKDLGSIETWEVLLP